VSRAKAYVVYGREFPTQRALEETVRVHLDFHPLDELFIDAFLAAVLNELDQRIIDSGQHANGAFERLSVEEQEARGLEPRPGPLLLAQFEPSGQFLPVSAYPWRRRPRDHRAEVAAALKELLDLYLPQPEPRDCCSECGSRDRLQAFYPDGGLDQLLDECLDRFTLEEVETRLGFNRFDPKRDNLLMLLPAAHRGVRDLLIDGEQLDRGWRCPVHAVAEVPASLAFSLSGRAIR
jgi:hypothetical protein